MSKRHNIVVIAGLSGVGKSFVVNELMKKSDELVHFSAGTLIKKQLASIGRDKLRLMGSSEILQNQYLLIDQLLKELESVPKGNLILFDAHMVIDTDKEVVDVPFDIFERLNPSKFVHLYDKAVVILNRRASDKLRLRPQRSVEFIEEQQNRSFKMAEDYAKRLSIPIVSFASGEMNAIADQLLVQVS